MWFSPGSVVADATALPPHVSLAMKLYHVPFPVAVTAFGQQPVLSVAHSGTEAEKAEAKELSSYVASLDSKDITSAVTAVSPARGPLVWKAVNLMHAACVKRAVWATAIIACEWDSDGPPQSRLEHLLECMTVDEAALVVVSDNHGAAASDGDPTSLLGSFETTCVSQVLHMSLSAFVERLRDRLTPGDCIAVWLWAHWVAICHGDFPLGHPERGVGYGDVTERFASDLPMLGKGKLHYVLPSITSVTSVIELVTRFAPDNGSFVYHAASHTGACNILRDGINPNAGDPLRRRDFGPAFYLNPSLEDAVEWAHRE